MGSASCASAVEETTANKRASNIGLMKLFFRPQKYENVADTVVGWLAFRPPPLLINSKEVIEYLAPVLVAQDGTAGSFGVRHHTKYIALPVADTGNVMHGTVGIGGPGYIAFLIAIAIDDLPVHFQFFQRGLVRKIPSFTMCHRNFKGRALVGGTLLHKYILTHELLVTVAQQNAWQQSALAQDLESIAYAQHLSSPVRKFDHALHHRTEAGNSAASQVIAIAESAG